jgi:hypothetical protein
MKKFFKKVLYVVFVMVVVISLPFAIDALPSISLLGEMICRVLLWAATAALIVMLVRDVFKMLKQNKCERSSKALIKDGAWVVCMIAISLFSLYRFIA